jgi:hypothetical protein
MRYLIVNFSIIEVNGTQNYKVETIFIITMLVASDGIEAAVSLESMVFAMCGLGTQDTHC